MNFLPDDLHHLGAPGLRTVLTTLAAAAPLSHVAVSVRRNVARQSPA